jgi:hypothetical protein
VLIAPPACILFKNTPGGGHRRKSNHAGHLSVARACKSPARVRYRPVVATEAPAQLSIDYARA